MFGSLQKCLIGDQQPVRLDACRPELRCLGLAARPLRQRQTAGERPSARRATIGTGVSRWRGERPRLEAAMGRTDPPGQRHASNSRRVAGAALGLCATHAHSRHEGGYAGGNGIVKIHKSPAAGAPATGEQQWVSPECDSAGRSALGSVVDIHVGRQPRLRWRAIYWGCCPSFTSVGKERADSRRLSALYARPRGASTRAKSSSTAVRQHVKAHSPLFIRRDAAEQRAPPD